MTLALFLPTVACGPGTLKVGEGDVSDGMVDTDGDGVPDSPDSDGDGIPDDEDDEPNIPNDDDEDDEEAPFPYTGSYEGGVSLEIWNTGGEYCHESEAEFEVTEDGDLSGEGWCYNDSFEDEVSLAYEGEVDDDGEMSGTVELTLWLPGSGGGGHGGGNNWALQTLEFEMSGSANSEELDLEFDGEVGSPQWGFDVDGKSWGEK